MLTQEAADYLARIAKDLTNTKVVLVPGPGDHQDWDASALGGKHSFFLHMRRGRKVSTQITAQERYETNEILLRLDIDGPTHGNPDGTIIPTPHLHIYREGYDDKWAFPVPTDIDISSGDAAQILANFLKFCGVDPLPPVQGGVIP